MGIEKLRHIAETASGVNTFLDERVRGVKPRISREVISDFIEEIREAICLSSLVGFRMGFPALLNFHIEVAKKILEFSRRRGINVDGEEYSLFRSISTLRDVSAGRASRNLKVPNLFIFWYMLIDMLKICESEGVSHDALTRALCISLGIGEAAQMYMPRIRKTH